MADEATEGATANPEAGAPAEGAAANPEGQTAPKTNPQPAGDTSWRESIADEKTRKLADRFTSPAELAKAYAEANTQLSQRVKLPGDDATDEDRSAFRKAMGVPEKVEDYKVTRPEFLTEEQFNSDEMQGPVQAAVASLHEQGATQAQVDAALNSYFEYAKGRAEQTLKNDNEYIERAETKLREDWGQDYDANKAFADQAISRFEFGNDLKNAELSGGRLLGSDPNFVRMMAEVGRRMGEGGLQAGMRGTEAGADIQSQYDEVSTQAYAAHDRGDMAEAKRLDAQRRQLSDKLHGTGPIPGRAA
jgi:hypothetical protein